MTMLEIVQAAARELGLPVPNVVVGALDPQNNQLVALLQRTGRQLVRENENGWTALQKEWVIVAEEPIETTGDVTNQSAVISGIPSTAAITAGYFVCTGDSIPQGARVASVDSATQVTLTMQATGTASAADLIFAQDTYDIPDDFDRFINDTYWDRTNRWRLFGPDSPQFWQWMVSGTIPSGPRRHFRQLGRPDQNYRLWPPPAVEDAPFQVAFEYVSKNWVLKADGTTADLMTAQTDEAILDSDALIMGVKWRYFQIKQFDYAPLQMEYNDYVANLIAGDGGAPSLSLSGIPQPILISSAQVPDGNWPGSAG